MLLHAKAKVEEWKVCLGELVHYRRDIDGVEELVKVVESGGYYIPKGEVDFCEDISV